MQMGHKLYLGSESKGFETVWDNYQSRCSMSTDVITN